MKRSIFFLPLLFSIVLLFGQNEFDAVRYSQTFHDGSARFVSMGGAFGALGGDFSSLSYNPAGIAVYRSSEVVFTPSFNFSKINSDFMGSSTQDSKYRFNLDNVGIISTFQTNNESGWISTHLGVGYNKHTLFNQNTLIYGTNTSSSLLDNFTNNANNNIWSDYYEELAWNTDLMPYDTINDEYWNDLREGDYNQIQKNLTTSKGSIGEMVISFGANYNHQLYLGGTIGIYSLYYEQHTDHQEEDVSNGIAYFDSFRFRESFQTSGVGYTFKLGAIYKPAEMFRIGAAMHFPTVYDLQEDFYTSMHAYFDDGFDTLALSPYGSYEYSLTTPFKFIGSIAYQFEKKGLLSLDYEMLDYSTIRFHADDYDYFDVNQSIQNDLKLVTNIRAGGEYRLNDFFSLRGGYAYYGSPHKNGENKKAGYSIISGGFGIRDNNFFLDFGYSLTLHNEQYYMYNDPGYLEAAKLDAKKSKFVATLGFKF